MGHDKLRKFKENESFRCLLQPSSEEVLNVRDGVFGVNDHEIKGHWNEKMFDAERPIVLELGCGRGEYTVDLALRNPDFNYIGVDIKGARLWKGAKYATEHGLGNVAFLRTRVEFVDAFFAPGEVSEIWLTFSDPQLKSEGQRLTSPWFLTRYRKFLKPGGIVHLKTDSQFLYQYSLALARENGLSILAATSDLYSDDSVEALRSAGISSVCGPDAVDALFEVQTYYERMFLQMGLPITYLAFQIDKDGEFKSPETFDSDYWRAAEGKRRSFGHGASR